MTFEISAFRRVPRFAQGQVRDLRVRWALEEVNTPYTVRFVTPEDMAPGSAYRATQPFGQVPTLTDEGVTMFETGAILLHLARRFPTLLPDDAAGRGQASQWLFAALSSIEPALMNVAEMDFFEKDEEVVRRRRPGAIDHASKRLRAAEDAIGERTWAGGRFSVADIMLSTVLRIVDHTDLLDGLPALAAYKARCEGRDAFHRALDAQRRDLGVPV